MLAESSLTPRARAIANVALELLEEDGIEALSMRRLAARLGIRAPSIYKHFASKEALEAALISDGFRAQGAEFERALERSDEPLVAMGASHRAFAREHPHLYRLMYDRALNRDLLDPGAEESAAAPVVRAAGNDRDLARAAFAFAHGMAILELNDRFPPDADLDAAWQRGLRALQAAAGD